MWLVFFDSSAIESEAKPRLSYTVSSCTRCFSPAHSSMIKQCKKCWRTAGPNLLASQRKSLKKKIERGCKV